MTGNEALAALADAQSKVAEVEGQRAAYAMELAGIDQGDRARFLDDPDGAAEDADRADALRRRIRLTEGALDVARERVAARRAEALLIEAEACEPAIAAAREAVDAHIAKVEKVRAELVELSGLNWHSAPITVNPAHQGRSLLDVGSSIVYRASREDALRAEVAKAERPAAILRSVAAGGSVSVEYDDLPECLQRGGWADLGWTPPAEAAERQARRDEKAAEEIREALDRAQEAEARYVKACEAWARPRGDGESERDYATRHDTNAVTAARFAAEDARKEAAEVWNRASKSARRLAGDWPLNHELAVPPWGRVPTRNQGVH